MPDYDNNNQGVLFKNKDKTEDKHPDYKGSATINSVEGWLSAWIKKGKQGGKMAGETFMSLSFTPKDQAKGKAAGNKRSEAPPDSDIPFLWIIGLVTAGASVPWI